MSDTHKRVIDTHKQVIDTHFEPIDTRLEAIDTRLEAIDTRLEAIDTHLEAIDTHLEAIEIRFSAIDWVQWRHRDELAFLRWPLRARSLALASALLALLAVSQSQATAPFVYAGFWGLRPADLLWPAPVGSL